MVPDRIKTSPRLRDGLIVLACILTQFTYLLVARYGFNRFGFPLDDAWIYQTYARNLAEIGQWAFIPDVPSTGSTSILWTPLLVPGHWLPVDPRWWTQTMGLLTLIAIALGGARLVKDDRPMLSLAVGLALAFEWHLVWAAASGMETGLFAALLIWFWVWLRRNDPAQRHHRWFNGLILGLWGGILLLARPEGVLAMGAAGLYGLLVKPRDLPDLPSPIEAEPEPEAVTEAASESEAVPLSEPTPEEVKAISETEGIANTEPEDETPAENSKPVKRHRYFWKRLLWAVMAGVGFTAMLLPFFGLNLVISGKIWPNTFYAKQTEYAALWATPYLLRFFQQASVTFIGAQILLIPGLIYIVWKDIRQRNWLMLVPWGWALLHWAVYAARLPVDYQHGRYAMPVVPLIVIYGLRGLFDLIRLRHHNQTIRLTSLAWALTVLILFPAFFGALGAPAYGRDVTFIEDQMVAAAKWLEAETDPDVVIAAHDIGALGYFAPRPLIDLAGLVSPDVIPFMHNDEELARYILRGQADYLIVFPKWNNSYRKLTTNPHFCPVWHGPPSPLGALTIYQVRFSNNCPVEMRAANLPD